MAPSWGSWTTQINFPAWTCKSFQQDHYRALMAHDTFTSSILKTVKNFLTWQINRLISRERGLGGGGGRKILCLDMRDDITTNWIEVVSSYHSLTGQRFSKSPDNLNYISVLNDFHVSELLILISNLILGGGGWGRDV